LRMFWLTPKARSNGVTTGKRRATRRSSAPSSTSYTQKRTRHWGRRCHLPLRSHPADREHAPPDDGDAASGRAWRAPHRGPGRTRASEQER
jgi:hypothetical protein